MTASGVTCRHDRAGSMHSHNVCRDAEYAYTERHKALTNKRKWQLWYCELHEHVTRIRVSGRGSYSAAIVEQQNTLSSEAAAPELQHTTAYAQRSR